MGKPTDKQLTAWFLDHNPTPKPTTKEIGYTTKLTPRQEQLMARRVAAATSKAFEEAAGRANLIAENDPSKAIRIAFLRFSAELRVLAKEQTHGTSSD